MGAHCSTEEGDGVFGYVNLIADPERWKDPGSDELRSTNQPREEWTTAEPFQEGKRVIASVQGVEALSTGSIDCVPADLLVDSGAVACLVHSRVLKRIGRSTEPLRSYTQSLNAVSGHSLKTRGVINLQLRLGSLEKTIPFVVVDQLHVDAILGTEALKEFKAVIDLEDNVVTLKGTGEAFPIGSPRVEESYHARISSSVRICPGGQALVVADVTGQVVEGTTVLVEGLVDLNTAVRVARTLCLVQEGKVIVEICNPSTEDIIVKRGTHLAAASIVPETAFSLEAGLEGAFKQGPRDSRWIDSVIGASGGTAGFSSSPKSTMEGALQEALKADFE
ncbi:hypothetical protein L917_17385, partial [Phytophthora nicotianae]